MKNIYLITLSLLSFTLTSYAQEIADHAMGLRLGDSNGFGAEISYQKRISDSERLEFGLGWRDGEKYSAIRAVGLYQWVKPLDERFNWYTGVGGGISSYSLENVAPGEDDSSTSFLAAANIGIEYDFNIPLLISFDFRPEFGFGHINNDLDFDIALGLKYQF